MFMYHFVSDETEHDYEEIRAIVNDSTNTPVEQFPAVYKTLLSTWTDGKTVLFHAFQVVLYRLCIKDCNDQELI